MKHLLLKSVWVLPLIGGFFAGCTGVSQTNQPMGQTNSASAPVVAASVAASPCANIYNPVKNGAVKNYKVSIGDSDARFVQEYADGAANFSEILTLGKTTLKHNWNCTPEGLIAANPGSMMNSGDVNLEPKHISGVTLPKDSEITLGKTWTAIYESAGKSAIGEINSHVNIESKVAAVDEEVKVPAGTFKTVKIESLINMDMKINGNKIPVPPVTSIAWYAPNVGMVKVSGGKELMGSTLEYAGNR